MNRLLTAAAARRAAGALAEERRVERTLRVRSQRKGLAIRTGPRALEIREGGGAGAVQLRFIPLSRSRQCQLSSAKHQQRHHLVAPASSRVPLRVGAVGVAHPVPHRQSPSLTRD